MTFENGFAPETLYPSDRNPQTMNWFVPFMYSKWFTQNSRLSMHVSKEFLDIFLNNNFENFKDVLVQSLLLLKRKILYNVVELKMFKYKYQLLYYYKIRSINIDNDSAFFLI